MEDIVSDFSVALQYFGRGISRLRRLDAAAANAAARHIHQVSEIVAAAVAESEIDSDEISPSQVSLKGFSQGSELVSRGDGYMVTSGRDQRSRSNGLHAAPVLSAEETRPTWLLQDQLQGLQANNSVQTASLGQDTSAAQLRSWASIAAPEGSRSAAEHRVVSMQRTGPELHIGRPINGAMVLVPWGLAESQSMQRRVVWIFSCPPETTIHSITARIHTGPLMSIALAREGSSRSPACCIIFHKAEHAQELVASYQLSALKQEYVFFKDEHLELGEPYPADREIQLMDPPTFARRRLSIVRKVMFTRAFETRFVRDIKRLAGEDNVELIYIYNSGNATVVLAGVRCALMVKDGLEKEGRRAGPYQGLTVTFSKDPCEAQMRLVSVYKNRNLVGKGPGYLNQGIVL
ncbi:MAG: hypothetical protein M1825_000717 [Sarcosagium campestre]|nr:MAG: hypothetical protein M1825_000717 [Sarcosagium campestre]